MTTIRFEQVSIKATRRWKENGKQRQETKVFMQTINPFNKNTSGEVKSRAEIEKELLTECEEWLGRTKKGVPPHGHKANKDGSTFVYVHPERVQIAPAPAAGVENDKHLAKKILADLHDAFIEGASRLDLACLMMLEKELAMTKPKICHCGNVLWMGLPCPAHGSHNNKPYKTTVKSVNAALASPEAAPAPWQKRAYLWKEPPSRWAIAVEFLKDHPCPKQEDIAELVQAVRDETSAPEFKASDTRREGLTSAPPQGTCEDSITPHPQLTTCINWKPAASVKGFHGDPRDSK